MGRAVEVPARARSESEKLQKVEVMPEIGAGGGSVFRHNPTYLLLAVGLQALAVYGAIRLISDPAFISPKGILVAAILIAGSLVMIPIVWRLWRCSVDFTIAPDRLITVPVSEKAV